MYRLGLEKEEEPEIKLPTFSGLIIEKAKEVQKKHVPLFHQLCQSL